VLEEGLRGLDDRTSFTHKRHQQMTDVLFVVEAGDAPARKPKSFTFPVPINNRIQTMSISYPIIEASKDPLLGSIAAGDKQLKLENVVDLNVMARRALKDAMPGMVLRGVTRAISKAVLQDQLSKNAGAFGAILGAIGAIVTEQADDRMWRMLPGRVYVARGYLPPGMHKLMIDGRVVSGEIKIGGQYAMVPIRLYEKSIIQGEVMAFGQIVAPPLPVTAAKSEKEKPAAKPASAKNVKKKSAASVNPKIKPTAVSSNISGEAPVLSAPPR